MSSSNRMSATNNGDALIGHTGFVGSNLTQQHYFPNQFNSQNIKDANGHTFDTLVCAAAPGSMIAANRSPEVDKSQIDALCRSLGGLKCKRFVLISSIAVLDRFDGQDVEGAETFQFEVAYGRNRRALEEFCENTFERSLILRLPALFGQGLKKNFLFDLLNPVPTMLNAEKITLASDMAKGMYADVISQIYELDASIGLYKLDRNALNSNDAKSEIEDALAHSDLTAVQFTNPNTQFQYYGLDRLWSDIEAAFDNDLSVLHLATEPVLASRIHQLVKAEPMPHTSARLHLEDMHSRHATLWGAAGPYLENADRILERVSAFMAAQRASK